MNVQGKEPVEGELPAGGWRTLALGLLGALACYLAHPPVAWSALAWIGPAPWLLVVRAARRPGRRGYLALWLAGAAYWLAAIQWIRLPFWANIFGLFLLAGYLGVYLPAFVALARVAVHRLHAPLWLAGAVVWTGLELVRAHLLTGFLMASLAHTQVKWPWIIQMADLTGEYGVTFLILAAAGAIAVLLPGGRADPEIANTPTRPRLRRLWTQVVLPASLLLAALIYGAWHASGDATRGTTRRASPRIALIQTDMLSDWKGTPERDEAAMRQQIGMSLEAARDGAKRGERIDLIVWPETMFRTALFVADPKRPPPTQAVHASRYTAALSDLRFIAREAKAAVLVGIDRVLASAARNGDDADLLVYNAAAFIDRDGELQATYEKMHLLPFGEFIPFAEWLPMLADYAPITGNSLWGAGPKAFLLDEVVYAPNICYETVLPHLIRRQVVDLTAAGQTPDVLVNLTNDAWFWGSSELDMHLASGVFRAVEMRT
ncbi:MAG TPA: apolipoprotein N-acyltransferase, partial [Lacipirellulaceae bacterium]|nr:apolipoprotein N-acyltransferase [Lacipirellulaceae bacterium]